MKNFKLLITLSIITMIIITIYGFYSFVTGYFKQAFSPERNPKNYIEAKENIPSQDKIQHFPKEIPSDANNVVFYKYIDCMGLDGAMVLEFTINSYYIDKELNKFDLLNTDNKKTDKSEIFNVPYIPEIEFFDFTYYPLNTEENNSIYDKKFPCYNGIAINKKENKIMYYYFEYEY